MAGTETLLGDALSELEQVEARAYRAFAEQLGGGLVEVRGGLCVNAPVPAEIVNRVVAVTPELDLDAVATVYSVPYLVSISPGAEVIEDDLDARGYTRDETWAKLTRDAAPAPATRTELRIERTDDDAVLARTLAEGFGVEGAEAAFHVLARDGFTGFVAWAGDDPAAAALMYVDGEDAWFGGAATRPAHRKRGAQSALIAARIEHARSAGATRLSVETALEGPSNRNVRAAGFAEAYARPSWRSPA